eukprot:g24446.t1
MPDKVHNPCEMTGPATFSDAIHEYLEKASDQAMADEVSLRKLELEGVVLGEVSYPPEKLYGSDWKIWIFAAGRVSSEKTAKADPRYEFYSAKEQKIVQHHYAGTWSFAMRTSIDGKVQGPGTFGFQDMVAVMEDPSLVKYTPRTPKSKLREAFHSRWIHGLNTQAPWNLGRAFEEGLIGTRKDFKNFVSDFVTNHYKLYDNFGGLPWFIGEYGANGQAESLIISDLESMDQKAASDERLRRGCS